MFTRQRQDSKNESRRGNGSRVKNCAKVKNWHIITSAPFYWPKQVTWLARIQGVGGLTSLLTGRGKICGHFCNLPPEAGVGHCLSQPSIPHPCCRIFQEHAIHSFLSVSLSTDGHSMLLHPCGERHHLIASNSTTLLFKGTAQFSQNPFALFLKPLEKAPDWLTWVRCQPWSHHGGWSEGRDVL